MTIDRFCGHSAGAAPGLIRILALALLGSVIGCGGGNTGSAGAFAVGTSTPSLAPTPTATPAAVLFVSTAGNDANPGDRSHPLRTIGGAAATAPDSGTIVVAPGTYAEAVTTSRPQGAAQGLTFIADSTGELSGVLPGNVTIQAPGGGGVPAFEIAGSAGTIVEGFLVTGAEADGIAVVDSDGVRVQSCVAAANSGADAAGIRLAGSANVLLFNNLIFRNGGPGIAIGGVPGSAGARLINNTIYANQEGGVIVGAANAASPGASLRNNILVNNGNFADAPYNIAVTGDPGSADGFTADFDAVFPPTYLPTSARGHNDVDADPLLADPDNAVMPDFRVVDGSPAVDAGTRSLNDSSLGDCLRDWPAVLGARSDPAQLDLGFHYPDGTLAEVHCGIALPAF